MTGIKSVPVVVAFFAMTRGTGCRRLAATSYTAVTQSAAGEQMNSGQRGSMKKANGYQKSPTTTYRN